MSTKNLQQYNRQYFTEHREQIQAYQRKYYADNRERLLQMRRDELQDIKAHHPEVYQAMRQQAHHKYLSFNPPLACTIRFVIEQYQQLQLSRMDLDTLIQKIKEAYIQQVSRSSRSYPRSKTMRSIIRAYHDCKLTNTADIIDYIRHNWADYHE